MLTVSLVFSFFLLSLVLLCLLCLQGRTFLARLDAQDAVWREEVKALNTEWRVKEVSWQVSESEWRNRERELLDRLLRQAQVKPLRMEFEQIVKLPDPEIPPASFVDEALRDDEILEAIETKHPELTGASAAEIRMRMPQVWEAFAERHRIEHTPLRMA